MLPQARCSPDSSGSGVNPASNSFPRGLHTCAGRHLPSPVGKAFPLGGWGGAGVLFCTFGKGTKNFNSEGVRSER